MSGKAFLFSTMPCVYGWRRGEQYLYIGSTACGGRRLYTHNIINRAERVEETDHIDLWFPPTEELVALEYGLIGQFSPKYNRSRFRLQDTDCERKCLGCQKSFQASRSWQKFCSKQCRAGSTLGKNTCRNCQKQFLRVVHTQTFCSKECRKEWLAKNHKKSYINTSTFMTDQAIERQGYDEQVKSFIRAKRHEGRERYKTFMKERGREVTDAQIEEIAEYLSNYPGAASG